MKERYQNRSHFVFVHVNFVFQVNAEEGVKIAKEKGFRFLESSALTGENCVRGMEILIEGIHTIQIQFISQDIYNQNKKNILSNKKKDETNEPKISNTTKIENPQKNNIEEKETTCC